MKKSTLFITAAIASIFLFSACKNNQASAPAATTDTTGFAQFQQWQAMNAEQEAKEAAAAQQSTKRSTNNNSKSGTMNSSTTNEAKAPQKKGWSKAAKYAVIGGAGGAVTGAIINKKDRVKGAVIGGVVLGAGGYIFGRSQDKKDGRY